MDSESTGTYHRPVLLGLSLHICSVLPLPHPLALVPTLGTWFLAPRPSGHQRGAPATLSGSAPGFSTAQTLPGGDQSG